MAETAKTFAAAGASRRDLVIVEGDVNTGVQGEGFAVLFSFTEHGPVSLRVHGAEWLYRAPRPVFWRAATENDKGCGFPLRSAAWQAADAQPICTGHTVEEKSARKFVLSYRFASPAVPGMEAELRYTVTAEGEMTVQAVYHGAAGLPELPCFGFRLATPRPVGRVSWTGLSGETYPDRYKGGVFGRHTEEPHLPDYLVPQDCGCHVGTHSLRLDRVDPTGRTDTTLELVMADKPFAFSALPHSAQELEAADHREDLGRSVHTHLCVYAAMRGVGGINSWGADVEDAYHVSAEEDHAVQVTFRLV